MRPFGAHGSDNNDDSETKAADIGVMGGRASTVTSGITSRCCVRASCTQEKTRSQGTAVTNAEKQGIGFGGSPKTAAPGATQTGTQVERGRCARASGRRTLVESADEAASSQAASAIVRNAVGGAVASAHNLTTMATVVVAMDVEFGTLRDAANHAG